MTPEELEAAVERLTRQLEAFERDRWTGGPALRGEAPRLATVDALPTPSADWAYRLVTVPGDGATTADVSYQCLRNAAQAYGWRVVATG